MEFDDKQGYEVVFDPTAPFEVVREGQQPGATAGEMMGVGEDGRGHLRAVQGKPEVRPQGKPATAMQGKPASETEEGATKAKYTAPSSTMEQLPATDGTEEQKGLGRRLAEQVPTLIRGTGTMGGGVLGAITGGPTLFGVPAGALAGAATGAALAEVPAQWLERRMGLREDYSVRDQVAAAAAAAVPGGAMGGAARTPGRAVLRAAGEAALANATAESGRQVLAGEDFNPVGLLVAAGYGGAFGAGLMATGGVPAMRQGERAQWLAWLRAHPDFADLTRGGRVSDADFLRAAGERVAKGRRGVRFARRVDGVPAEEGGVVRGDEVEGPGMLLSGDESGAQVGPSGPRSAPPEPPGAGGEGLDTGASAVRPGWEVARWGVEGETGTGPLAPMDGLVVNGEGALAPEVAGAGAAGARAEGASGGAEGEFEAARAEQERARERAERVARREPLMGDKTVVLGTKESEFPARYAALPKGLYQASHVPGVTFAKNVEYPLENTRDYGKQEEREKVLMTAAKWDPRRHVTDAVSSSVGPAVVARVVDEAGKVRWPVLGGNNRVMAEGLLKPEQWDATVRLARERAGRFGVEVPAGREWGLVRVLEEEFDLRKEGQRERLQEIIDALNPSEGLSQGTGRMAWIDGQGLEVDAVKPAARGLGPVQSQEFVRKLVGDGKLDRNTRLRISQDPGEAQSYVQQVVAAAAYRHQGLMGMRVDTRRGNPAVVRGMIEGALPLALELRARGQTGVADALAEALHEVGLQAINDRQRGSVVRAALAAVAGQATTFENGRVIQRVAQGLERRLVTGKDGRVAVDASLEAMDEMWEDVRMALATWDPDAGSMFGEVEKVGDVVGRALDYSDAKMAAAERSQAAAGGGEGKVEEGGAEYQVGVELQRMNRRLRELRKRAVAGKASAAEHAEMETIERRLGQEFMDFDAEVKRQEAELRARVERERQAQAVRAGMERRLLAGDGARQGEMFGGQGGGGEDASQLTLFETGQTYFQGFGDEKYTKKPRAGGASGRGENRRVLPPAAAGERGGGGAGQLDLFGHAGDAVEPPGGGGDGGGAGAAAAGGTWRAPEIVAAREGLIAPLDGGRNLAVEWLPAPVLAGLRPHQVDGVARVLQEFFGEDRRRERPGVRYFGLFDDAGTGKTAQELAVAVASLGQLRGRKTALIVTENRRIIADAFAREAARMGLEVYEYGGGPVREGTIYLATYHDVARGLTAREKWGLVVFDEAHNLRNADGSDKAHEGIALMDGAEAVLLATATPLDEPQQLYYLARLAHQEVGVLLERVGVRLTMQRMEDGSERPVFKLDKVGPEEVAQRVQGIFDELQERGVMLKREVSLRNLTVRVKRVQLEYDDYKAVDAVMRRVEAEMEAKGVGSGRARGLMLLQGRMALESRKAGLVVEEVKRVLGQPGAQAVVFASRVNEGQWLDDSGTLRDIAARLERVLGVKVGRMIGGMPANEVNQSVVDFQAGKLRVIVGTPEMMGTGLSLDDTRGDRPREIIMVTPPLSALKFKQLAKRIDRLNTRSRAVLTWLQSEHWVDAWNSAIVLKKVALLHAAVQGDVGQLVPRSEGQAGAEGVVSEGRRRAVAGGRENLEFDFGAPPQVQVAAAVARVEARLGIEGDGPAAQRARAQLLADPVSNGEVIASALEGGWSVSSVLDGMERGVFREVALHGLKVERPADLARALRVIRNPHQEMFGVVVMDAEGRVLRAEVLSVGTLSQASASVRLIAHAVSMAGPKAARFVPFHNHPSGDPTPSRSDKEVWQAVEHMGNQGLWPWGAAGDDFLITNGDVFYSVNGGMQPYGDERQLPDWELVERERLMVLDDPTLVKAVANAVRSKTRKDRVTVMLLNKKSRLVGMHLLPSGTTFGDAARLVLEAAARNGAAAVALDVPRGVPELWVRGLQARMQMVGEVELLDVYMQSAGKTLREMGLMEDPAKYRAGARPAEEGGAGEMVVREDGPEDRLGGVVWSLGDGMYAPVELAHADEVRIVQMPELVRLARDLMDGKVPVVQRMRKAGRRGYFVGVGSGEIALDPTVARDVVSAAKTLGHEIGHLVDWIGPGGERTLARGNLLGRLAVLRDFRLTTGPMDPASGPAIRPEERDEWWEMAREAAAGSGQSPSEVYHTIVEREVAARGLHQLEAIREELIAVSQWWKPWNMVKGSDGYDEKYDAYRRSAKELYADAMSVLLNSPGRLKAMAPGWWKSWWAFLDRKPEVKRALLEVQRLLGSPGLGVLVRREGDLDAAFVKGDEIFLRKHREREERYRSWRGWWDRVKQEWVDIYEPVVGRVRAAKDAGVELSVRRDPELIFEEVALADNQNLRFVQKMWAGVVQPLEGAGMGLEELGRYLCYKRVMEERWESAQEGELGGRSVVFNPQGHTPETARMGMLKMRLDLGMGRMTVLAAAAGKMHELFHGRMEEAYRLGMWDQRTWEEIIKPNRDRYAAFVVLDYLGDRVPASIRQSVGTFKDIANPFLGTLLKGISLNRAIQWQRAKLATRDFMRDFHRGEIRKAATRWVGDGHRPVDPEPGWGHLELWEKGRRVWYEVPEDVAEMFEGLTPARASMVTRVLDTVFRNLFYPMWIKYRPDFQLLTSPLKDISRTVTNAPGGTGPRMLREQVALRGGIKDWLLGKDGTARGDRDRMRLLRSKRDRGMASEEDLAELAAAEREWGLVAEMMENFAISTPYDTFAAGLGRHDAVEQVMRDHKMLPPEERKGWWDGKVARPLRSVLEWIELQGIANEMMPKFGAFRTLARVKGWHPRRAAHWVRNYAGVPNFRKRGKFANINAAFIPFLTVTIQGLRADAEIASGRAGRRGSSGSAAGWWMRFAMVHGWWRVLQAAAAAGLLGAALKEFMDGVSDYDKTNYLVLPLGYAEGGDFDKRPVYLRVPVDETHRLIGALLHKTIEMAGDDPVKWGEVWRVGAGQIPSMTPVMRVGEAWSDFLGGANPMDGFRGREILSNDEWLAGGWPAWGEMGRWTWGEVGLSNYVRPWREPGAGWFESAFSMTGMVNKFVRVSDQGYRERQMQAERAEDERSARMRMRLSPEVRRLITEHGVLGGIRLENRTGPQKHRLRQLRWWYNQVYRPNMQRALELQAEGGDPRAILQELERGAREFERSVEAR